MFVLFYFLEKSLLLLLSEGVQYCLYEVHGCSIVLKASGGEKEVVTEVGVI